MESSTRSTVLSLIFLTLCAILGAALVAAIISPLGLTALLGSLSGSMPRGYWYLSRGAGIVAYLLIWLSVALGLMVTNKLGRLWPGGPATVDLHQFTSLLGLAFAVFHGLVLLGDRYIGYSIGQLLIPFTSYDYRPAWVGLGQLGFYLAVLVTFSFYVRQHIGYRTWRALHYGSFAVYLMVTAHGFASGTDTANPAVRLMYGLTAAIMAALTVYRVWVSARSHKVSATKVSAKGARHVHLDAAARAE